MKKQINPTIKAHLIRGAFYLLLLSRCLCNSICTGAAKYCQTRRSQTLRRVHILQVAHSIDGTLSAHEALAMKLKWSGNPAALSNAELVRNLIYPSIQKEPTCSSGLYGEGSVPFLRRR